MGANRGYSLYFNGDETESQIEKTRKDAATVGKKLVRGQYKVHSYGKGKQQSCGDSCVKMGETSNPKAIEETFAPFWEL